MTVSISAYSQMELTVNGGLSFGRLQYDAGHSGEIRLGTDGYASFIGNNVILEGFSDAGKVSITGENSGTVEIRCSVSGHITHPDGYSLTINNVETAINNGKTSGTATPCTGTDGSSEPAFVLDLSITRNPLILFGGRLQIPQGNLHSGNYRSSNSGGQPITISVVFQ